MWVDCRRPRAGVVENPYPFRLYVPSFPHIPHCGTIEETTANLANRPERERSLSQGVAYQHEHYAGLLPPAVIPNFAGPNAIGTWE